MDRRPCAHPVLTPCNAGGGPCGAPQLAARPPRAEAGDDDPRERAHSGALCMQLRALCANNLLRCMQCVSVCGSQHHSARPAGKGRAHTAGTPLPLSGCPAPQSLPCCSLAAGLPRLPCAAGAPLRLVPPQAPLHPLRFLHPALPGVLCGCGERPAGAAAGNMTPGISVAQRETCPNAMLTDGIHSARHHTTRSKWAMQCARRWRRRWAAAWRWLCCTRRRRAPCCSTRLTPITMRWGGMDGDPLLVCTQSLRSGCRMRATPANACSQVGCAAAQRLSWQQMATEWEKLMAAGPTCECNQQQLHAASFVCRWRLRGRSWCWQTPPCP